MHVHTHIATYEYIQTKHINQKYVTSIKSYRTIVNNKYVAQIYTLSYVAIHMMNSHQSVCHSYISLLQIIPVYTHTVHTSVHMHIPVHTHS